MKTLNEIIKGLHWHFLVLGYEKKLDNGMLLDTTDIQIIEADTDEEAIMIAKSKIKKRFYFVRSISQCSQCGIQKEMMAMIQKQHEN